MNYDLNKDEYKQKKLKQSELASKVGVSRQTLLEIEKGERPMSWNTFMALITVFCEDMGTNEPMRHFGIYTPELQTSLVSPEPSEK